MLSLDKQEVQDICGHTALRGRKWSVFNVYSEGMMILESEINMDIRSLREYALYYVGKHRCSTDT